MVRKVVRERRRKRKRENIRRVLERSMLVGGCGGRLWREVVEEGGRKWKSYRR